MLNQVPNLNHCGVNHHDSRFGFLPFVGGLAVGALAGGGFGPRPCGPNCGMPMQMQMMPQTQFVPVGVAQPQFVPVPFQPLPATWQSVQTNPMPITSSNNFFIR